jgi:hypothetical protein
MSLSSLTKANLFVFISFFVVGIEKDFVLARIAAQFSPVGVSA